jgi:hypothetical protein
MMTMANTSTIKARVARLSLTLVLSGAALGSVDCYRAGQYRGDGRLTDDGWFAYSPRYVITFPEIVVTESNEHVYTFTGAPPPALTFHLNIISGRTDHAISDAERNKLWSVLKNAHVSVTAAVVARDGKAVCEAGGQLAGDWIPSVSAGMPLNFWHHACTDIELSSPVTYQLRLRVDSTDGLCPVTAIPILEGGGRDST